MFFSLHPYSRGKAIHSCKFSYHLYASEFVRLRIDFSSSKGKNKQLLFCYMRETKPETHPQTIQPLRHQLVSQDTEEKKDDP